MQTDTANNISQAEPAEDLAAIREQAAAFVDAFNRGDASAVVALWTKEGEYVENNGERFIGRESIKNSYADYFAENPDARIEIVIDSVRLLSETTAIEDGHAVLEPAPEGGPGLTKYTVVHVKVDGKWHMASVRDTWIATPSTYDKIADLEWLIGTWLAEERGVNIKSVCRWIGNKSFVERRYMVTQPDGMSSSGVQLIGWNAANQQVQSWDFSPEGGHAIGDWTPREGGWSAAMTGVTGDGIPTASVNLLTRLDDNTYYWQSVQRSAGSESLPDTDQVILKRQSPTE